jgi:hypothetical protein
VLGNRLLAWWFVGFWPAVDLYGVTLIIVVLLGEVLFEQLAKVIRRTVPWRRFLRRMAIALGIAAAGAAAAT